jgi:hypothetical protein
VDQAERLARRWGLNLESDVAREVIDHRAMIVGEFISRFRLARVRRSFPGEYLSRTLQEAFDSGDPRVRKLLLDSRWVKR